MNIQDSMNNTFSAMSFNIYVGTPSSRREISVLQTIRKHLPDTLGVQEASTSWMAYLSEQLGDIYDYTGEGREGGKNGEHSAIFYRKDHFQLVKTGTQWLSDTPNEVSKFPESCLPRIFTYALLSDISTGTEIMVINTHLDHISREARNKQIGIILDFIKDHSRYPVVFTGDLNDHTETKVYEMVTAQMADSSNIAHTAKKSFTFHNYGQADGLIDFIFVSPETIHVSDYKVITDEENGMLPSDHYPVYIKYEITN